MIKKENCRLMITLDPTSLQRLTELSIMWQKSKTKVIKEMINYIYENVTEQEMKESAE